MSNIDMNIDIQIDQIVQIAKDAGHEIMQIYNDPASDFTLDKKADDSPLTKADLAAHHIIVAGLEALDLGYPIVSEEGDSVPYELKASWERYRLIDPLDGTKEFIKKNGEFTVNIALIENQKSILGVVYVPVAGVTYAAKSGGGAYLYEADGSQTSLEVQTPGVGSTLRIVGSRSHHAPEVESYVQGLEDAGYTTAFVSAGSSLKLCMLARGDAHVYPRFVPTSERDTAAAQCVLEEAGGTIVQASGDETGNPLVYTKSDILNPYFVAASSADYIL